MRGSELTSIGRPAIDPDGVLAGGAAGHDPNQATDLADLKRKSVRGGMVTFASQGASVVIQLASTVTLARLLSPDDYGIIAMVAAVTAFAGMFRDLNLSAAAVQQQTLTNAQQTNLFWTNVALGFTLTVLLAAASPLVAWFYQKPEVLWVTVALSASFSIGSVAAQSTVLLVRQMRFGRQAAAALSGALASLSVSVVLALNGFRYWSLVWGQLAGAATTSSLLFSLSPFRPGLPRRGTGVRAMLRFGMHVTAFDFVNYFHRNLDNILIGRVWGPVALGFYSRGYSIVMLPINNLRGPINAVAFPAMSRLQDQPAAFRSYYMRVTSMLALLSMPLTAFLFVASRSVIELLLGRQWMAVAPVFSWLALVGFIQPVITLWGMVALSRGMARRYLRLGLFNTTCTVAGFLAGIHWGGVGVAAGYAIVTYLTVYPILAWTFHGTPLRVRDFLSSIFRPMTASLISAGACGLVSPHLDGNPTLILDLCSKAAVFGAVYFAMFFCLPGGRAELGQLLRLLSSVVPGKRPSTC